MSVHRILIVEDEFIIAENLRKILVELGYMISGHALDADEAIQILEEGGTDLALLDVTLGLGMDGIALGDIIRARFFIPFIFLTSHSDAATILRAKDVHPAGFLVKPFNKAEIYAGIEIALVNVVTPAPSDYIYVKISGQVKKVAHAEITLLKADRVYVEIHRVGAMPMLVRESLNVWEEKLPSEFLRVHRSYIVNLAHVASVEAQTITVAGKEIPVSRTIREEVLKRWTK